ncbi:hypothetical protein M422DRAFT_261196 [Sphaerobolus stellatus SS14]|uniref:Uncharacterized protein n=1 Tax=Sphaerobolus stellatus (strain SS14) TaxID=990650 RepID=A0A0C9V403_SPHS4|nr:hypothetical protein M422DRAFT_261196 [Sphaerobolus stellatus SS14]
MASQSTTGIFKPKLNMKTSRLWAKAYQAVQQKCSYRPQSQQDVLWSLIYRSSNKLPQLIYVPLAPPPPPPPPPPSQLLLVGAPLTAAPAQISLGSLELKPISSQQEPTNLEYTHQFELTQEKELFIPSLGSTPSAGSQVLSPVLELDLKAIDKSK